MSKDIFIRAYVQGDWTSSSNVEKLGFTSDPNLQCSYKKFLEILSSDGVLNTATWHLEATGVAVLVGKSFDVIRNNRQIDESDCVISYFLRDDPPSRHWGSLCNIAYAVGKGKSCYVIASPECIIWKSHFIWHPLIKHYNTIGCFRKDLLK